jgi:hypothetical protein
MRAMPRLRTDRVPRFRPRPTSLLLLAIAGALLLLVCAASAGASPSIEGVWEFDQGQIGVASAGNGTFVGTVVQEVKFAECPHPVGQQIWTDMTQQADGSYWGFHQWYFEKTCALNETLGPTAWRVKEEPSGRKYLRVCFGEPGTSQPTIPAEGPETGVTYSCLDSQLTAPLPVSGVAGERLSLPSAKQCLSGRLFKIHLREPKYDPFKKVLVTIQGHRIATARRGNYVVATIDLKGFPRGAFAVKIRASTVLGHHLLGSRTYHTCAAKPRFSTPRALVPAGKRKR